MKGLEKSIHNIPKEKETITFVKEDKKKEQKEILLIKTKDDVKIFHLSHSKQIES